MKATRRTEANMAPKKKKSIRAQGSPRASKDQDEPELPDDLDLPEELELREDNVEDQIDDAVPTLRYDITSYGIDFDVKGLVTRLQEDKVFIPGFQRSFVWRLPDASRFIESLLLGLPVPGIFLAKDPDTSKLLVIDGQQRLKSLQFFYSGDFNPDPELQTRRVFRLSKVQSSFEGKTYTNLDERDRQTLDDSVIHATIIKQDSPSDDDTSIYHVYERLNSGGRRLTPQEIRSAIYHGQLIDQVKTWNDGAEWRQLFGKKSARLKDQEMILRFMAFVQEPQKYKRPMAEFINEFTMRNRNPGPQFLKGLGQLFQQTMVTLLKAIGPTAFRPERNFNAAVFDSVAVGLARRLTKLSQPPSPAALKAAYESFVAAPQYVEAISRSTADQAFVERRLAIATDAFARLK
jgi:hypothetical protein